MSLRQSVKGPFFWVWLIPASLIAAAALANVAPLAAIGIGLAAALSLSGSI